jgi:diphthine-ammonia ligase
MSTKNILCSWSGGKDSCFALLKAIEAGYNPKVLLNVLNEEGRISRSHGIPAKFLHAQAASAGLPIHLISSSWQGYEENFSQALNELKATYDLGYAVFGDIDLQAHRDWEEKICAKTGLQAFLPLWKQDRRQLVMQMLESGIETMIVSCNETMGERFIGKLINPELVNELESMGIDACGENGEYHTLVLNCPLFSERINASLARVLKHDNYWFGEIV